MLVSMASKSQQQTLQAQEKVLQDEIAKFRAVQKDIQKCVASRNQLDAQLVENKNVQDELDRLEADAAVYKMVGPVLVQQDTAEAKQTVKKRLDYITKEKERYDGMIKELEQKQQAQAGKLSKLQQEYQQSLVKAGVVR